MRRSLAAGLIAVLCAAGPAEARDAATIAWTAVGAGAGFGLGMLGGLRAFDDAVNSDSKVWTTAIIGGVVGALVGFSIGHARHRRRAHPSTLPTKSGRDASPLRALARGSRLRPAVPTALPE